MTIQKVTDTATSLDCSLDAGVDGIETLRDTVINVVKTYPDFIKSAPFCCWKQGKVPYNPVTGKKAKVDDVNTFGRLSVAYQSYMTNRTYKGIGLKVSEPLGAIDLDKCVGDDVAKDFRPLTLASLSENAQRILSLFPNAVVELSPSRAGLHLFFRVPEGFTFDRDEYYINNRKLGIEVYFAETTNRFLTVTGNRINTAKLFAADQTADKSVLVDGAESGDGAESAGKADKADKAVLDTGHVSPEALTQFLDSFMKRPEAKLAQITLPEGGSILTDEEVLSKAKSGKNGDRFKSLYEGDWLRVGDSDINWSHSEADIALCGFLAFYCRGNLAQMDRLFRASGLMRDKWDRPQNNSSYGVITMTNAIAHCQSFYSPQHEWEKQVNTFRATIDSLVNAWADSESESKESIMDQLLGDEALIASAWAMQSDLKRYTKLREIVSKSHIGMRNYEKLVKKQFAILRDRRETAMCSNNNSNSMICSVEPEGEPLVLTGLGSSANSSTGDSEAAVASGSASAVGAVGFIVPKNWVVNDSGISFIDNTNGVDNHFANAPLFVSACQVNVDDGKEKLSVTFRRKGVYKTITAPRADLLNKHRIIDYANTGIPVSSDNAALLTKYIAEFETANDSRLAMKRCITRAGWVEDEFFPYYLTQGDIQIEEDENKTLASLKSEGSEALWLSMARQLRKLPFARAFMAASFASPLLHKMLQRNIYYHSWANSKSGKTAAMKFAMSIWGDPEKLTKTYYSTTVGMEQRAGMMKHLPLALDELQSIDPRVGVSNMVYMLGNGYGKPRGKAKGGLRLTEGWNNCILSTGEQPITSYGSMDGVISRLLEVYAVPIPDPKFGKLVHQLCAENYGFAGPKFIKFLIEEVLSVPATSTVGTDVATASNTDNADNVAAESLNTLSTPTASAVDVLDDATIMDAAITGDDAGSEDADESSLTTARERIARKRQRLGNKAGKLIDDFERICSRFALVYDDTESQFDNIAVLALADYYSSISIFGLSEDKAFEEAITLGETLMKNQQEEEQRDVIDRAWEYVCAWVVKNHNKFITPTVISPGEIYGKIQDGKCYVLAPILKAALEEAKFSERKSIKGFAERGYLNKVFEAGEMRNSGSRSIGGQKSRIYDLNISFSDDEAGEDMPAFLG